VTAKNDITGDMIQSKSSRAYSDNWEKIFGKTTSRTHTQVEKNMAQATEGRVKAK